MFHIQFLDELALVEVVNHNSLVGLGTVIRDDSSYDFLFDEERV